MLKLKHGLKTDSCCRLIGCGVAGCRKGKKCNENDDDFMEKISKGIRPERSLTSRRRSMSYCERRIQLHLEDKNYLPFMPYLTYDKATTLSVNLDENKSYDFFMINFQTLLTWRKSDILLKDGSMGHEEVGYINNIPICVRYSSVKSETEYDLYEIYPEGINAFNSQMLKQCTETLDWKIALEVCNKDYSLFYKLFYSELNKDAKREVNESIIKSQHGSSLLDALDSFER